MKTTIFGSIQLEEGFATSPVILQSFRMGDAIAYAVTLGSDFILSRQGTWDLRPGNPPENWIKDHFWLSVREAQIRAEVAVKAYREAIALCKR